MVEIAWYGGALNGAVLQGDGQITTVHTLCRDSEVRALARIRYNDEFLPITTIGDFTKACFKCPMSRTMLAGTAENQDDFKWVLNWGLNDLGVAVLALILPVAPDDSVLSKIVNPDSGFRAAVKMFHFESFSPFSDVCWGVIVYKSGQDNRKVLTMMDEASKTGAGVVAYVPSPGSPSSTLQIFNWDAQPSDDVAEAEEDGEKRRDKNKRCMDTAELLNQVRKEHGDTEQIWYKDVSGGGKRSRCSQTPPRLRSSSDVMMSTNGAFHMVGLQEYLGWLGWKRHNVKLHLVEPKKAATNIVAKTPPKEIMDIVLRTALALDVFQKGAWQ
ncbi:unnamed protein product [Symbiodinium sp. CCMP2592]|nr:unnamed protein product [Symbiodinium sp. CCMP2592]